LLLQTYFFKPQIKNNELIIVTSPYWAILIKFQDHDEILYSLNETDNANCHMRILYMTEKINLKIGYQK